ncbi:metalloregulator ArsR/SmtB family transcription factor [Candidatus Woesearchaeota archaeon]|nr:metalloregulator ArsR/SmtB family transcription factor [Candidatus Woesearchaeota archaeon]
MKCSSYYLFFDTISNKTRMSIIESLLKSDKSVGEIARAIGEEQSKVSHSLKKLMVCNFLNVTRQGKKRIYSLNQQTVVPILNLVDKHVSMFCSKECLKVKK